MTQPDNFPPPPPTGLSRTDLLVLRAVADIQARAGGDKAMRADVLYAAEEAWHNLNIGVHLKIKGPDAVRNGGLYIAQALDRLICLKIVYEVYRSEDRCRLPDRPAYAVKLGGRGLAIAAAVTPGGELHTRSPQTAAAIRRKILAAVLEAEQAWIEKWPEAANELDRLRQQPANLAAVPIEPQRTKTDRRALNGILRRLGKRNPEIRKLLGDKVSKVVQRGGGAEPLSLEEFVRSLIRTKSAPIAPIAAIEQREEEKTN